MKGEKNFHRRGAEREEDAEEERERDSTQRHQGTKVRGKKKCSDRKGRSREQPIP